MQLATWFLAYFLKGLDLFFAKNLESVDQRAAKLPAIKLWEWFDRARTRTLADWFGWSRGRLADFFLRPSTLTVSNFAALWPNNSKFLAKKDLNLLKRYTKNQEASSILKVDFALSKWPHLHRKCENERFVLLSIVYKNVSNLLFIFCTVSSHTIKIWISRQFFNSKVSDTELNWVASLTIHQFFLCENCTND